ncbi:hypothetical protein MTR67_038675 [Solanum verrucosum]|uniref:Uncharacterized protein n=1 Tax=Solanum verrucosum TaxID=315347 RepID=A0AAF0ZPX6_SOLVR|nr:hypothetical protein MTR67_038675 [Solanum verrucosum]
MFATTSNHIISGHSTFSPLFQPTLQAPPIFQPVSQSSQSVDSASHSATMDQLMSQQAPTTYPTSQPFHLVHLTSHPASTEQDLSQQVPTVQAPFKKCIRRESQSYWTVEAIGDELIVVNFDYLNEPFGEARSLLSGFCGILACDCFLFPINFEKWSSVPMSYLNRVFDQIIKPKFSFKTTESNVRQHIYKSIGKKWGANKNNLWKLVEDTLRSKVEIIDNVPDGIPRDQWISFVDYQYKDSTKMVETGQRPGRAQIYITTHKNKDRVYVNESAKEICGKIELTLSQSTMDESQISPNDVVGKVLGKEHSGRVRCSCSSQCQENHNQMMNAHNQMMNAFKTYMIMKEGMIPEQFARFFASPSTNSSTTIPSDAASEPIPPMHTRRSCSGDSNPSHDNR